MSSRDGLLIVNADDLGRTAAESDAASAVGSPFLGDERPAPSRAVRRVRNALIAQRFHTTDWLFDLSELHPRLGGTRLEDKLELAQSASVEVMTHPGVRDEYELLVSEDWRRAVAGLRQGSFSALP